MKRREFLSAGLAAAVLPQIGRAASKPCPPSTIGIVGGPTTNTSCAAQAGAPAWFESMPENTWIAVAGGIGRRIYDVRPNPAVGASNAAFAGGNGLAAVTTTWTGGCVDQARGELILAANGGHDGYYGNEVYACALKSEQPTWVRLTDPTPDSHLRKDATSSYGVPAFNNDVGPQGYGRMRSVHGYNRCCFGGGKVWYAGQDSYASGPGGSAMAVWWFDRDALGDGPFPQPHVANEPFPWRFHGMALEQALYPGPFESSPSAFDRVGRKVWSLSNNADPVVVWSVDTQSGAISRYSGAVGAVRYSGKQAIFGGMWAAIAHDLGVLIAPLFRTPAVAVLDLNAPERGFTVHAATPEIDWDPNRRLGTGTYAVAPGEQAPGYGASYQLATSSVLVGCPWMNGDRIRRLSVPTRVSGGNRIFDPSGTFVWSELRPSPGGAALTFPSDYQGSFGKFNMVEDMGNGRTALVVVTDVMGPVYVYKLPA